MAPEQQMAQKGAALVTRFYHLRNPLLSSYWRDLSIIVYTAVIFYPGICCCCKDSLSKVIAALICISASPHGGGPHPPLNGGGTAVFPQTPRAAQALFGTSFQFRAWSSRAASPSLARESVRLLRKAKAPLLAFCKTS